MQKLLNYRFPALFLAAMTSLMVCYYWLPESIINAVFVRYFAVLPGSTLLEWLTPQHEVYADGTRILSSIAQLNILKGCEGTETLLILYAAIIAALRPLRESMIAMVLGTLLVFLLNQLRISSLFFIAAYHKNFFEASHGFIAPMIIVVCTGVFYMLWLRWADR